MNNLKRNKKYKLNKKRKNKKINILLKELLKKNQQMLILKYQDLLKIKLRWKINYQKKFVVNNKKYMIQKFKLLKFKKDILKIQLWLNYNYQECLSNLLEIPDLIIQEFHKYISLKQDSIKYPKEVHLEFLKLQIKFLKNMKQLLKKRILNLFVNHFLQIYKYLTNHKIMVVYQIKHNYLKKHLQ